VDQASPVHCTEGAGQLDPEFDDPVDRHRASGEHFVEALPRQQLAHHVGLAFVLSPVVDRTDVRVGHQRGDMGLTPEPVHCLRGRLGRAAQYLQGDGALQSRIARAPRLDRAILPDQFEQLVVRD
jgi:hypothetical protein